MTGTIKGVPFKLTKSGLLERSKLSAYTAPAPSANSDPVFINQSFLSSDFRPAFLRELILASPTKT